MSIVGLGQDSHRISEDKNKELIIGGVKFDEDYSIEGNSDGDVVLHAITNAVSSVTAVNVLGKITDEMCQNGITDSREYLKKALSYMGDKKVTHVAISIEAKRPKFAPKIEEMRKVIADILKIEPVHVGITATTGEGLTEFGKGNGIFVTAILTCEE